MSKLPASAQSNIESGFCDLQSELNKTEPSYQEKASSFSIKQGRSKSLVVQHLDTVNQDQEDFEQEDDFSERGDQVLCLEQDQKLSDREFKELIFQELYQDVKKELSKP